MGRAASVSGRCQTSPCPARTITIRPLKTVGYGSGADRDRTGDLLLAKQALSRLSYGPMVLLL